MSFFMLAWDLTELEDTIRGGESLNKSSIPDIDWLGFSTGFVLHFWSAAVVTSAAERYSIYL